MHTYTAVLGDEVQNESGVICGDHSEVLPWLEGQTFLPEGTGYHCDTEILQGLVGPTVHGADKSCYCHPEILQGMEGTIRLEPGRGSA